MLLNFKVVDWFGDLFGEGDYLDYEEDYKEVKNSCEEKIQKFKLFPGGDNKEVLSRPWK